MFKKYLKEVKFNQVIFGNVLKDLLQRKEKLAKKMETIEKQKEELEKDYLQEFLMKIWELRKHISKRVVYQITIIIFSLIFFYYLNKDKSLFKKLFNRT